ncbi:MAG: carbohydrate kinase family protein [Acidimicrobiia bacterium]|nr:carbohydrate kinase family protein [Acidimicrobiia bacterium]
MPAAVFCAGNLVADILVRPVSTVRWDTTTWVDSIQQSIGGNGANTSFALARLGAHVVLTGAVGADPFGHFVLDHLRQAGVDTSLVQTVDASTAVTVGLVHDNGARAFLHRPGASAEAFSQPVDFTAATGCSHFHLANVFGLPRMRPQAADTLAQARRAGLTTSLDTGWDARGEWMSIVEPCLPHLDLLMVNLDEARHLTGLGTAEEAAAKLRDLGAGRVVVKLGGDGCAVFAPEFSGPVPAFDVPVVDTTGAGDCFAGGFLTAWLAGASLEEAAVFANAAGARSVQSLGAVTGLLPRQEMLDWMKQTPQRYW